MKYGNERQSKAIKIRQDERDRCTPGPNLAKLDILAEALVPAATAQHSIAQRGARPGPIGRAHRGTVRKISFGFSSDLFPATIEFDAKMCLLLLLLCVL